MLTRLQGAWKNFGMTGSDEILFLFKMVYDKIETRVKVVACGNGIMKNRKTEGYYGGH